jgi:hypothetical protein
MAVAERGSRGGRGLFSLVPGYVLRRLVVQDGVTPQSFVADLDQLLRAADGR